MSHADRLTAERVTESSPYLCILGLCHSPGPVKRPAWHPDLVYRIEVDGIQRSAAGSSAPAVSIKPGGVECITINWRPVQAGEVAGSDPPSPAGFKLYGVTRCPGKHAVTMPLPPVDYDGVMVPTYMTAFAVTPDDAAHVINRLLGFGWVFNPLPDGMDPEAARLAAYPTSVDDLRPVSGRFIRAACERPPT